jgi:pimeloyl-ACP methyl ester carboxylesterase
MEFSIRLRSRAVRVGLCLALSALVSACGFRTLKKDLVRTSELAAVEGHAEILGTSGGPIVVVAYNVSDEQVADLFLLPRSGSFFFALPAGTYRIAAFEDRNRDLSYEPAEEPAVLFGPPPELLLQPGERRTGIELTIDPNSNARLPFAVSAASSEPRTVAQFPALQLGTIVAIDDPRFSQENGKLGLWDPLRFLFDVGAGVYFLEEYDPHKIPVLFVHGALGHPGNWTYLISQLDRSRFQPWLVYYPSAPHLDRLAQMLVRALGALQFKYGFSQLVLVAHSMGGLVTRAALNYAVANAATGRLVHVPAFVSISSPWNGHAAAAMGVEYAPVVAPSWKDLAPDSPFLTSLPQTALPAECEYSLLFSYHGNSRGEANDGAVTVSSELSMPIQRQAAHVMGFDETHISILHSSDVAAQLNAVLARVR